MDERGESPAQPIRIFVRPIAHPLPPGFFAFGTGIVLLTALQLGWIAERDADATALLLLTFVAPLEAVAALFAFLARDAGAATTLAIFAATWTATGTTMLTAPPVATNTALGVFYLTVSAFLIALAVASAPGKPIFAAVIVLAVLRFAFAGIGELPGGDWGGTAAAWVGLPLTAIAFYGGLALLLEDARKRPVLPLFRREAARRSIESGLEAQVEAVEREAGVRNQL